MTSAADSPRDVADMFAGIARRYDLMNALMTLGRDQAWRRRAVAELGRCPGGLALDVGTGTGDFLPLLSAAGWHAVGLDLTAAMMQAGREKLERCDGRGAFLAGDALRLPFPDGSFDGVINGFLLRNVADVRGALAEMRRVLRPGGRLVCLEIIWPTQPLVREAFSLHLGHLVPLLGRLISGHEDAYSYLPRSVAAFMGARPLAELMREVGLAEVRCRRLALGCIALHRGRK